MKLFLFLLIALLISSLLDAREGKIFFENGRWLKGDIQIQTKPDGEEVVVVALKSGSIVLKKSQIANIVYPHKVSGAKSAESAKKSNSHKPVNAGFLRVPPSKKKSVFDPYIHEASAKNQLDPNLVKAVIKQESNYKFMDISRKGASGLMQLMPDTAKKLGVQDIFDPRENIHAGTLYLRTMLEIFNWDMQKALAAYNAGPGAVKRYGAIPPYRETEDYVRKVMQYYKFYQQGSKVVAFKDKKGMLVITDQPYLP